MKEYYWKSNSKFCRNSLKQSWKLPKKSPES